MVVVIFPVGRFVDQYARNVYIKIATMVFAFVYLGPSAPVAIALFLLCVFFKVVDRLGRSSTEEQDTSETATEEISATDLLIEPLLTENEGESISHADLRSPEPSNASNDEENLPDLHVV